MSCMRVASVLGGVTTELEGLQSVASQLTDLLQKVCADTPLMASGSAACPCSSDLNFSFLASDASIYTSYAFTTSQGPELCLVQTEMASTDTPQHATQKSLLKAFRLCIQYALHIPRSAHLHAIKGNLSPRSCSYTSSAALWKGF